MRRIRRCSCSKLAILLVLAMAGMAQAQTLVDYNTGGLEWTWAQGTGGPATKNQAGGLFGDILRVA